MKKYLVTVNEDLYTTYIIEAECEEKALDKALMGIYETGECLEIYDTICKSNEKMLIEEYKNHE